MISRDISVRSWRLLGIYNAYRVAVVLLFFSIYWFGLGETEHGLLSFNWLLICYSIIAASLLPCFFLQRPVFEAQVMIAGTFDLLLLTLLITALAKLQIGLILLLNVNIAILSLLTPGRMAMLYAALASFMLLMINLLLYIQPGGKDPDILFYSGVHGASFFATAIVAWYLANLVQASSAVAARRTIELREIEKINEYIVARLHSGIIYTDEQQNIKLINTTAKRFFKVNTTDSPKYLSELSPLLSKKFIKFRNYMQNDTHACQAILEDMQLKIHFNFASPNQKGGIFIFIDDLSATHQAAQQLKLASLGRFTASIAHELRNPLGAIDHAAQLLGESGSLDSEDEPLKYMIMSNCNRMNTIIKNILQLSRREKSAPKTIALEPFLIQFIDRFNKQYGSQVSIENPHGSDAVVHFDAGQLEQILVILCENALIHGKDFTREFRMVIRVVNLADSYQIQVQDTGRGIAAENTEQIFEPFYSSSPKGTGMGLFIAKDLCEINQAKLNVLPREIGACFAINFSYSNEILI